MTVWRGMPQRRTAQLIVPRGTWENEAYTHVVTKTFACRVAGLIYASAIYWVLSVEVRHPLREGDGGRPCVDH